MGSVRGVALAIAVLLFAAPLWGQTGTSAIRGTITDQQGRLVAECLGDPDQYGHQRSANHEVHRQRRLRI